MTGSSTNNRMARNGIDWGSVAIFFSLMLLGWLNIYAAVFDDAARAGFSMDSRYGSQLIWMGVSVLAAVVIMLIDEIYYHILAYPSYILMLAVLLATLFIGTEVNGAKSWLRLGGFSVQPAEFAKFTTALALARYMNSYSFSMADWRSRLYAVLLLAAPMAVILLQNDAGSAIVFASFLIVFYREGFNSWVYVALGMVVFLFVFSFLWNPATLLAAVIVICTLIEGFMNGEWRDKVRYPLGFLLAALCHDFGKAVCTTEIDGVIHSYGHETAGLPLVQQFLERITTETKLIQYVLNMTELHMQPNIMAAARSRLKSTNKLLDRAVEPFDLIQLSVCDGLGKLPPCGETESFLMQRYEQFTAIMARPYVMGKDLIAAGLQPGVQFSEILSYAHKLRLAGIEKENALRQSLAYARKMRKENPDAAT